MKIPCAVDHAGEFGVEPCKVPARWWVWLATEPYDPATTPTTPLCDGHFRLYRDLGLIRNAAGIYIGQHRSPTTLWVTAAWGRSIRADGYQPRHARVVA